MLTIKTSAHVPDNRHRMNFHCIAVSTGAPLVRVGGLCLLEEWLRLFDAESRRVWLAKHWRSHMGRVRLAQGKNRP